MYAVRVVAPPSEDGQPCKGSGTKVFMADGTELHGVASCTLHAKAGELWRADVELFASSPHIELIEATFLPAGANLLHAGETVVIEVPGPIRVEQQLSLKDAAEKAFPGRKVLVLGDGIRISRDEQLNRIEAMLGELLAQSGNAL